MTREFLLSLFWICVAQGDNGYHPSKDQPKPVQMDLYYEALCPDCTGFITKELYPVWEALKNTGIFSISIYPYGNAKEIKLDGGNYTFRCQHGKEECLGNMLEACMIKSSGFDPRRYMTPIACMETAVVNKVHINIAAPTCVAFYMPWTKFNAIASCASGLSGMRLMHKFATRTRALRPQHTMVPWLVFNGVYKKELHDEALKDLKGVVCELYKGESPKECRENSKI